LTLKKQQMPRKPFVVAFWAFSVSRKTA